MIYEEIRKEIELKIKKLERVPKYYDERKNLVIQNLRSIGDVYSFWLENPELRKDLLLENKKPKTIKKMAIKGIHYVNNGWYHLSKIREYGNFLKYFDESKLKILNKLIEPNSIGAGDFRKPQENSFLINDVTLNINGYTPPSWEKVPEKIGYVLKKTKKLYDKDPLESAIYSHLSIIGIQPFFEGNKRCARLIQDRILYNAGLPPAIIPADEGVFYRDLLKKTLPAYGEDNKKGQKQFYDYCASKVNDSLDEILGDLFEEP